MKCGGMYLAESDLVPKRGAIGRPEPAMLVQSPRRSSVISDCHVSSQPSRDTLFGDHLAIRNGHHLGRPTSVSSRTFHEA